MSKYSKVLPLITDLAKIHPEWGSDQLAEEIAKIYPEYSIGGLGRFIRRKTSKPTGLTPPKILLFDIETSLMETYSFTKYPTSIHDDCIMSDTFMISWASKWLFEDEIDAMKLTPKEAIAKDDRRITEGLWQKLEEADIIIGHNCRKFDIKIANTRFLKHKLGLPTPYESIDTLLHFRKMFRLPSNRLDFIAKNVLGIEGKHKTSMDLWIKCMFGDKESIDYMDEYCQYDVKILEDAYLYIRPYIKGHPNLGLYIGSETEVCPNCGSSDLHWTGTYRTQVSEYDAFRCNSCKATGKSRKATTPKEIKDRLVKS